MAAMGGLRSSSGQGDERTFAAVFPSGRKAQEAGFAMSRRGRDGSTERRRPTNHHLEAESRDKPGRDIQSRRRHDGIQDSESIHKSASDIRARMLVEL